MMIFKARHQRQRGLEIAGPDFISISFDRLKLILSDYVRAVDRAASWAVYAGLALTLWCAIVVSEFPRSKTTLGVRADQWEVGLIAAAVLASGRALWGLGGYLRRPSLSKIFDQISRNAEVEREERALFIIKYRGADQAHRLLVYHDVLWNCYLLPHCNVADLRVEDVDDVTLCDFIARELGIVSSAIRCNAIPEMDLTSRKHSEFYRLTAVYHFSFYAIEFASNANIPDYISEKRFLHNGRDFIWLTISEMEADDNTRRRNMDVTRHLADHFGPLILSPPDSVPAERIPT